MIPIARVIPFILMSVLVGCNDSAGLGPVQVAGTYDLRSITGASFLEAPLNATILLKRDGSAERRATYPTDAVGGAQSVNAVGTYRVVDSMIRFTIRETWGSATYLRRFDAEILPEGGLSFSYPRPADGTIVETYG